jgi:two-component system nitrogen regulation response regulator NtrX
MITLAIEGSGGSELTYNLVKQTITVGAASQNDVVIRAPGVAPRHLIIQRNDKVFTFIGQNRQVVVLNGERRSRGVLRVGDRVRIGTATLVFKAADEQEDAEVSVTEPPAGVVETSDEQVEQEVAAEAPRAIPVGKARSEIVLYTEPRRLAEARNHMVEIFRAGPRIDLVPSLQVFFESFFPERQAMLALLDEEGMFEPIVSEWSSELKLPARTFDELESGGRFAILRIGSRQVLIYPAEQGALRTHAYLVVETTEDDQDDDELLLAELSRMLAVHWERVECSSALYGPWEIGAREQVEAKLKGTSQVIDMLRGCVTDAARSSKPVLVSGHSGSGRLTVANLIASLHVNGSLPVQVLQACKDSDDAMRTELLGPASGDYTGAALVERARRGALVVRDVHLLSLELQHELAVAIRNDLNSEYGPAVRWMVTTEYDVMSLLNDELLDGVLFNLFQHHMIRIPGLDERREDLPLLILDLIESIGEEQGKTVRGIELETLSSLLSHPFDGQLAELIGELRRVVTATPDGEIVRGVVPAVLGTASLPSGDSAEAATAALLAQNDLKIVIPAVERLIIDRVLRRTKGNQSKAARVLKLSRGALIAKMKDYDIPDYRYLRRQ